LFVVNGAEKTFHIDIYYARSFEGTITEYAFMISHIRKTEKPDIHNHDLGQMK